MLLMRQTSRKATLRCSILVLPLDDNQCGMKSKLRVLNLEDNANDGALNDAMISARWPDCEYVRVVSRDDFVAALEAGGFDLILSDFTLPGFDGREALDLAQEKRPEVPFLFVSGTIGEDSAVEALKNGATDYVLKHRLVRLIPAVDRALREVEEHAERERAEEAMRQSEHKYRELFECLGDAAFLADETSGKIIDTNRQAEAVLGCSRTEILGHKQPEFLTLENTPGPGSAPEANPSVPATFPCEMIRVDGSKLPVEVRATRLTLYGRNLVLRLCRELARH
jgi:PAS domain S-box-containing protein